MRYTPRQVAAFAHLVQQRLARETARAVSVSAMGSRGDVKEVEKYIKRLHEAAEE